MAKKKIIIIGRGGGQNQDTPTDITELQNQIQQLTAERNALSLQLSAVTAELEQANADVTTLTSEKVALQESVDELNTQITALNARIEQLEETIKNMGGDVPGGEIIPGGPHNPENDAFEEDFLWIENIDDTDGTITLNLTEAPFMYYSYDDDTEFQKMVSTDVLSIPAHSKIYLRWKGKITCTSGTGFISSSNCNHNIGGELKNGGLKSNVYQYLFTNDTKLIDASQLKLSATTLATYCYQYMFSSCTSLTTAPTILPATTLANQCYNNMFSGCTSLTTAPAILPATALAQGCYSYMFNSCKSLTTAPELPATTLASNCYESMFYDCTRLTKAPELPATTKLSGNCYSSMFRGCTRLNYVKTNAISWSISYANNWLYNVAPNGIVDVLPISTITENSTSGVPSGWTKQIDTSAKNTINIHNVSGLENTISIPNKYSAFKYKTNNDTEYKENPKTTALTITLKVDETLTIDGIYYPSTSSSSFTGITSTENINVSGEVNYSIPYMFFYLFCNNTKLIDASQLKLTATTLANKCYSNMFNGCTSLTSAPELPATTLADYCYYEMFYGCTSLTTAPELPATILASYCYQKMFRGCTSLTTAPALPATTLADYCYYEMFYGCTSLTTAPALPATTLVNTCYYGMFRGCTSLTTAPALPATTLADSCYNNMFSGCSKLNSLTFLSTEPFIYNDYNAKQTWLERVSTKGTFRTPIENKEWLDTYPRSVDAVPSGWTIEYIEPEEPEVADNEDILVVENVDEVEGTVLMRNPNSIAIQYSTNGSQFNDYTAESEISIGVGDKVYFKWSEVISNARNSTALVHSSVKYKVYGELKQGNNQYAYLSMFRSQSSLIDASELKLPATSLARSCYDSMFKDCTSLTTAPELPATTLASSCYSDMFNWCTSLTTAPELPATTLQSYCYFCMFYNCTSLTTAPELPATTLASSCYIQMFQGCTSLTTAPELPATTLASSCYNSMFRDCISLTTAPELPATTLASSCYYYMFYNCTNLNYVKHHIVDWNTSYTSYWLSRVAPSGTVYCPLNSTIPNDNVSGIPSGWTRVNIDENGNVIPDEPSLPEVAENEDILAIENVDTVEGTVKMTNPYNKTIQYSTDGSNFNKYTTASEIPIGVGEKVYFKWSDVLSTSSNQNKVNSTVKYKAYGELKKGNNEYAYRKMFTNETNLIDASKLKLTATTLAEWCYSGMFGGTALTTAPELPATTLASSCYYSMFSGCTSLTTAPELPATTMKTGCYNSMFQDCTSLTTAPALPATKLVSECFYRMFYGCTSLNYVKHNITTWNTANASSWLSGVASSGTVECPANSTIPSNNTSGIPTGWTRVDITEPTVPIE